MKPPDAFSSSWSDPPPPEQADDPLVGTTLQRTYRITRIIGEGGMGRVYEATHTRIKQKRYALKVLHPEFAREPEIRTRFQREAEAAASVSHPNVVGVYDVALTDQGWPFLVCEYLEGMDFSALVKSKGTLPPALAVHVALQVCDALITAHDSGIIHRDLKPQNVFILGDSDEARPHAKVLDFGLSRFMDSSDNELTKTGVIMGTPSYMSPEQARGERSDRLTDIYGVGAILYAAVTGRPPFNLETPQATLLAAMNDEPARPHTVNPAVSVYLEMVIQKAMAKKPSERYPDMRSLRQAIASLDIGQANNSADLSAPSTSNHNSPSDVNTARAQLVVHSLLGFAALVATIGVSVSGAVYLSVGYWPFTRTEVLLAVLAVAGTLLTPALLLVKKLHHGVWGSTPQVMSVLQLVRSPVITGLLAYGAAALSLRFIEAALLGNPDSPAWPGWNVILPGIALFSALLAWCRARWLGSEPAPLRRLLFGPIWLLIGIVAASAALYAGHLWQAAVPLQTEAEHPPDTDVPVESPPAAAAAEEATSPDATSAQGSGGAPTAAAPEDGGASGLDPETAAKAPRAELAAAVSQGIPALLPLSKKYPADANVLKALAMEYGSRSAGLERAMQTLEKAFELSPELTKNQDLQYIVLNTTEKKPPASTLAYQLLAEGMGAEGTDLLYKLSLTKPAQRAVANKYLARPKARQQFSEALKVAYDLRFASSCSGRLTMLERAITVGDERSLSILRPLASGTSRGCGFKKRKPCGPRCPAQAAEFQAAIDKITARLAKAQ